MFINGVKADHKLDDSLAQTDILSINPNLSTTTKQSVNSKKTWDTRLIVNNSTAIKEEEKFYIYQYIKRRACGKEQSRDLLEKNLSTR